MTRHRRRIVRQVNSVVSDTASHVLVVDDDTAIRHTLRAVLEDEGYTVLEAADGAAALDLLRTSPYPLITLLDLRMPHVDGEAVLRAAVSDDRIASHHAFALITANPDAITPACERYLAQLHAPVILKPFDLDILLDAVARASGWLAEDTDPHHTAHP